MVQLRYIGRNHRDIRTVNAPQGLVKHYLSSGQYEIDDENYIETIEFIAPNIVQLDITEKLTKVLET